MGKKILSKKGFIITTDSFIGIILMAFIIIVSIFYISIINLSAWNSIDLINNSRDISIVLEKSGVFKNSVEQESSELLLENLNATKENICFEVKIDKINFEDFIIVKKSGCTKKTEESLIVNRTFVDGNNFYITTVEAWYK